MQALVRKQTQTLAQLLVEAKMQFVAHRYIGNVGGQMHLQEKMSQEAMVLKQ
jgi:hypothetical protein